MKKICLGILTFTLAIASSFAETDHKEVIWSGLFSKKPILQGYFLWNEVQLRYRTDSTGMNQILYRIGALKKLNDHHEVGIIYGYIQTGLMKEHRPTLQHAHQMGTWGDVKFSSRSRLEARFLEDSPDDSARFRYMLRGQKDLNGPLSLVAWNEAFLNLTDDDWTGNRTFERNRLFLGTRITLLQDMHLEVGYMNQFVPRKSDLMEHILTVYLVY